MMDKKLVEFLKGIDFTKDEIDLLVNICPELEIIDGDRAIESANVLVACGYPQDDIETLIRVNPNVLIYDPKDLQQKLINLGGDIEEIIKKDPFII